MQRVILACGILLCFSFSTGKAEAPKGVTAQAIAPKVKYSREMIIKKISDTAPAYNVNTELALAIAEVESSFNPNVSLFEPKFNTYSIGLFQMFIPTARTYGFKGSAQKLKDPDVNIRLGLVHLNKCVSRFGQDVGMVACCHNAGEYVEKSVCRNNRGVKDYMRKVVNSYDRWKLYNNKNVPVVTSL